MANHPRLKEATIPSKTLEAKLQDLAVAVMEETQAQADLETAKRNRQIKEAQAKAGLKKDGPATIILVGGVAIVAVRYTDRKNNDVVGYRVTNNIIHTVSRKRSR